jgi:hypothetical protein
MGFLHPPERVVGMTHDPFVPSGQPPAVTAAGRVIPAG